MVFARLPSLGDRGLLTGLAKLRLDHRPHLVAGKIRIYCFMTRSNPILGDYFFIHRSGNGIYRRDVVDGLGDPDPSVSAGELWPLRHGGREVHGGQQGDSRTSEQ